VAKLKEKIDQLIINSIGLEIPPVAIPYTKSFKGITAATLQHFGAFYIPGEGTYLKGMEDRIIFPIRDITNKIVMFLGRHTLSQASPRYLNYPSGIVIPLYPPTISPKYTSAVLVEGIFDMLNLVDKGIENTICLFGTNTLQKDTKNKLLPYKMQGIQKLYLMMDGDTAGREAAKKLKPLIEQEGFECEIINLEEDTDPGMLSQEYVDSIREYINEKN